jgi:hypothetical protein
VTFTPRRVFIGAITLLIVGAIAASIWVAGSPAEARLRILDERRIQHLQSIEHWSRSTRSPRNRCPRRSASCPSHPSA